MTSATVTATFTPRPSPIGELCGCGWQREDCYGKIPTLPMIGFTGSLVVDTAISGPFNHYAGWGETDPQFGSDGLLWIDVPPTATSLIVDTLSTPEDGVADTIITLLSSCPRGLLPLPGLGIIARSDDVSQGSMRSRIVLMPPPEGRIYVLVDGYSASDIGVITVSWIMGFCDKERRASDEPMPAALYPETTEQTAQLPWTLAGVAVPDCPSPTGSPSPSRSLQPTNSPSSTRSPSKSTERSPWAAKMKGSRAAAVDKRPV